MSDIPEEPEVYENLRSVYFTQSVSPRVCYRGDATDTR